MKRLIGASVACVVMASSAAAQPPTEVNTETRSESLRKDALALTVIGGVTIIAGAGFVYAAQDILTPLDRQNPSEPWPDNIRELENEGQRLGTIGVLTMTAGTLCVVTGAVFYWRSRVAAREERVTVTPMATQTSAGVAFTGRF